jgi:hypothetical protein
MNETQKVRTFSDLKFNDHPNTPNGVQAKLGLGNDIDISVVSMKKRASEFGGLYGDVSAGTYEVAVFRNNDMIPLSPYDDVIGWQDEGEITELMGHLQGDLYAQFIANLYITRDESRAELLED